MSAPPAAAVPSSAPSPDAVVAAGAAGGGKKGSAASSSYYFFRSTPAHEAQRYLPTLISPGSDAAAVSSPSPSPAAPSPSQSPPPPSQSPEPAAVGSRWNAAGTWEERDMSEWAHSRLASLLAFTSSASPPLSVSAAKVTGDATLVYTRGRKRAGYDLSIQCEWRGAAGQGGEQVRGAIELPSVDQTCDDDYEMTVTVKERGTADDEAVDQLTRAARKLRDTITSKLKQFERELQEQ